MSVMWQPSSRVKHSFDDQNECYLLSLHTAVLNTACPGTCLLRLCSVEKGSILARMAMDGVFRLNRMTAPAVCNRQGNDWGPQYQAAIFPHGDSQKQCADRIIDWARIMLHRASSGADKDNGAGVGGAGGASGSVVGAGVVAPAWWEGVGGQVMTLVIPTKHEDFTPEESPGERPS